MDQATNEIVKQAFIGASDIAGILAKEEFEVAITRILNYENPLRVNMPRQAARGTVYETHIRVASQGSVGGFVDETNPISAQSSAKGVYKRVQFEYKTLATYGRITRRARESANLVDLLQEELTARLLEFRNVEEFNLLWANAVGTPDPNAFDGLYKLLDSAQNGTGVFAGVGTFSGRVVILEPTQPLTLAELDRVIDLNFLQPNMIITSRAGRRKMQSLLQAQQRFVDKVEVLGGFKLMAYQNIPIFTSTSIPSELTVSFPPAVPSPALTSLTGGTYTAIFFVSTTDVFWAVRREVTTEVLPPTTSQFTEFEIYEDLVPVLRNPTNSNVLLFNLAA